MYTASANPVADCENFAAIAAAICQRYGARIQTYAIVHPDCDVPQIEGLPMVVDRHNEFGQLYRPQSGAGYLIRPDGYIGYRADKIDTAQMDAYLSRIFSAAAK